MKKLSLLLMFVFSFSSHASSYWFDYCNASSQAYKVLRAHNPDVDIAPEKECARFDRTISINNACLQELDYVGPFKNRASYIVNIETENAGIFKYKVKFKAQRGGDCKLVKVKRLN